MIDKKFEKMGARIKTREPFVNRTQAKWLAKQPVDSTDERLRIDIRNDKKGEYFDIEVGKGISLEVIDVQPADRHLLLLARRSDNRKDKFLCGHDERHWFVAAIPEGNASTVKTAKEALKPDGIRVSQKRKKVKKGNVNKHKNEAFVRQGEWFFTPVDSVKAKELAKRAKTEVINNDPIVRGRGKPHMCEQMLRTGGRTVYVNAKHPNGVTERIYKDLLKNGSFEDQVAWRVARADALVYVKGRITHPDHSTVILKGWHLVQPNTESNAPSMKHVAFID